MLDNPFLRCTFLPHRHNLALRVLRSPPYSIRDKKSRVLPLLELWEPSELLGMGLVRLNENVNFSILNSGMGSKEGRRQSMQMPPRN